MAFVFPETTQLGDGQILTLRSAVLEDAEAIDQLITALLLDGEGQVSDPGELGRDDLASWITALTEQDNGLVLLATHHGRVVGLVDVNGIARRRMAHSAWFAIGLHPAWRRRGLGRRMLARMLAWAESHPTLELLTLHARGDNPHALQLYASLGFVEDGRTPRAIREGPGHYVDDVQMSRWVGPAV